MNTDELIEKISKAICVCDGHPESEWHMWTDMARAALAVVPLPEWRPIETAPKDELIDIIHATSTGPVRMCACYYDSICDEWRTSRPSGTLVCVKARHVTHWMQIPAFPESPNEQ